MDKVRSNIMLCGGTGCIATGSLKVKDAFIDELTPDVMVSVPRGLW
jgi:hypothetical protein